MWSRPFVRKGRDMVSADTKSVIERAKRIYAEQLQGVLEPQHLNRFVAIEPESGEYFLGDTFDEAVKSAREDAPGPRSQDHTPEHRAAVHAGRRAAREMASTRHVARRRAHGRSTRPRH